jgi:hypothetical protein
MGPLAWAQSEGRGMALAWLASAEGALTRPEDALTRAALEVNFGWKQLDPSFTEMRLRQLRASFGSIRAVMLESAARFAEVTEAEAVAIFRPGPDADIPPAYAIFADRVYFTPRFTGFGPKCRTAMLLHEAVHVFDRRSGEPAVHVSEWDPRFDEMGAEQQLHNASAYGSFAGQVHHAQLAWPREARFGAGRAGE